MRKMLGAVRAGCLIVYSPEGELMNPAPGIEIDVDVDMQD